MPDPSKKLILKMALLIILCCFVVALDVGGDWLLAPFFMLLGLYIFKRLGRTWSARNALKTDRLAAAHLAGRSPRADMERGWSRLGSARGRLLAGVDRQSEQAEQIQRLEYGQGASDYRGRLTQAYDLQAPPAAEKRKRKPKRKRFG